METPGLAALAATISAVVVIGGAVVRVLTAIILSKLPSYRRAEMLAGEQAAQCKFDHESLHSILVAQNSTIAKMLEQNGKQIEALRDANHAAELRHQVVLARLDRISDHLHRPESHHSTT